MSKRLIALVASILLILAGCGGGDDEGDNAANTASSGSSNSSDQVTADGEGGSDGDGQATGSSITKAEFIARADEICDRTQKRIEADFTDYARKHADAKVAGEVDNLELVRTVLNPNTEQELGELRTLDVPTGDEAQIEALLDAIEQGIKKAEAKADIFVANTAVAFGEAKKLAREYGLKECGKP